MPIIDEYKAMDFIYALDEAADSVEVSDWEAKFIESMLNIEEGPNGYGLTERQIDVIVKMMAKYSDQIRY